jgi:predicted DNA-binding transcriptional regulator YafY
MAETALARTARALDLIPYILEHPGIGLVELATAFQTTTQQLVSDLNLLFICGLPGYTPLELIDLVFDDGFVSVIDPQVLNRPRTFTQSEVISLKLALSALAEFVGISAEMRNKVLEINERLSRILPTSATTLASRLAITPESAAPEIHERITTVVHALQIGHWLSFTYLSATSDRPSHREVIPQALSKQGEWYYLQSYEPAAQESRTFRIDRMSDLADIPPQSISSPTDSTGIGGSSRNEKETGITAVIRVLPAGSSFIEENAGAITNRQEVAGAIEITISVFDKEWLIRELMAYLGSCEILEPSDIATEISRRATELLARYHPRA